MYVVVLLLLTAALGMADIALGANGIWQAERF